MTASVSQNSAVEEIGMKFDADKPRLGEMFLDFNIPLEQVARVWDFGTKKYGKGNWQYVTNARNRYTNALLRHLAAETKSDWDSETQLLHAAHVAWNALARLHFIIQATNEESYKRRLKRNGIDEAKPTPAKLVMEEGKDILDTLVTESISDDGYEQLTLDLKFEKDN